MKNVPISCWRACCVFYKLSVTRARKPSSSSSLMAPLVIKDKKVCSYGLHINTWSEGLGQQTLRVTKHLLSCQTSLSIPAWSWDSPDKERGCSGLSTFSSSWPRVGRQGRRAEDCTTQAHSFGTVQESSLTQDILLTGHKPCLCYLTGSDKTALAKYSFARFCLIINWLLHFNRARAIDKTVLPGYI